MPLKNNLPDIAPGYVGAEEVKEFILYGVARLDIDNYQKTTAPLLALTKSGGGKTALLGGLKEMFGCDLYARGMLTPAALGSADKKGNVVRVDFSAVSLYDEIDKASVANLSTLLQVFGGEASDKGQAHGTKIKCEARTLPIGCLLTNWREFAEERGGLGRIQQIEQLERRCALMYLEPASSTAEGRLKLVQRVALSGFYVGNRPLVCMNDEMDGEAATIKKLIGLCRAFKAVELSLLESEADEVMAYLAEIANKVWIAETVDYTAVFPLLVQRLAVGRTYTLLALEMMETGERFMEPMVTVPLVNFRYVGDVLLRHAAVLGLVPPKEGEKKETRKRRRKKG